LPLPEGTRLVSVMRGGVAELAVGETVIRPGDQVVAVLKPGLEESLSRALLGQQALAH
jgi:Trk K+ transport system NAD-binding subunit